MTVGIPVSSLKPPTHVSGLYQKNIQTLSTEIKLSHVRSISIKREPTQIGSRRRSLDSQRVQRSNSITEAVKETVSTVDSRVETNLRPRKVSVPAIVAPRQNRTYEKRKDVNEDQPKKATVLSRRRSIDPSVLSRSSCVDSEASTNKTVHEDMPESNTRARRFSGSGLAVPQQVKTIEKKPKTEENTPKKTVSLSRRRTIDPSTLNRNGQASSDEAQEKLRTLAAIAEKRKIKREEDERKKREDGDRADSYERKFRSFKTKARIMRNTNAELTERIANLQNEMMEINFRLSQLTAERVIHMIETVLNA